MKTWIEISKENLLHNAREFLRMIGPRVSFMAVVKANAYGHGMLPVAKTLSGLRTSRFWFGVDSLEEGIELRRAGIREKILVLGYTPLKNLSDASRHSLDLTVYNSQTIRAMRFGRVHLKIETGTTRQGVGEEQALQLARMIKRKRGLELVGLSTHFANIEDTTDHRYAADQLRRFVAVADRLHHAGIDVSIKHTAATAATMLFPETHFNLARVGIGLYGLHPSPHTRKPKQRIADLRPVLTWKTMVAQVKGVPAGTPISYGLTERVRRRSRVAVLPVGYSDGYDRGLSSVGEVLIRGRRVKVLGRVCMNMLMVDVTDVPRVHLEDVAVLIGRQGQKTITAEDLAAKIGTINYEIVARISRSLPRVVV